MTELREIEGRLPNAFTHAAVGMLRGAATTCATRLRFLHPTGREVGVVLNASRFSQGLSIVLMPAEDAAARRRPGR